MTLRHRRLTVGAFATAVLIVARWERYNTSERSSVPKGRENYTEHAFRAFSPERGGKVRPGVPAIPRICGRGSCRGGVSRKLA